MDSDDVYLPGKISAQVERLESHPEYGMVYCDYEFFDDSEKCWNVPREKHAGHIFENILFNDFIGSTSTIMVRKKVFDNIGLYNENLITGEDRNLYLRIAKLYQIGFINKILVGIREHCGRISYNYKVPLGTIEGIKDVIRIHPDCDPKNSRVVKKAMAIRTFNLAVDLFYAGKYPEAKKYYWESVKYDPRNLLKIKFLCCALMPKLYIDFLKTIKDKAYRS